LAETARLADAYGDGSIRFTTGQNLIIPNVPRQSLDELLREPLLEEFPDSPSPFQRGLVACVGTDFCNLAQIETKQRALELSQALEQRLGPGHRPLKIHWSGCPAGCGNHQAADIGLRGLRTKVGDRIVEAVAIYTGGRIGPHAVAGKEVLEMVPCDDSLPEVVARLIETQQAQPGSKRSQKILETHSDIVENSLGNPGAAAPEPAGAQDEI
jgi:ferredoxin-nitrite reductase